MFQYVFKKGDYIVRIDSSYPKVIFKCHGIYPEKERIAIEVVSYQKKKEYYPKGTPFPSKKPIDYRLATKKELMLEGLILQSIDFLTE